MAIVHLRIELELQWSRFFSKRKTSGLPGHENEQFVLASMEPLFFKAENHAIAPTLTDLRGASMEPLFFKAENKEKETENGTTGSVCFNGAAFFQSGKLVEACLPHENDPASMEPLFFKAENGSCANWLGRLCLLQWSRFFSKRKTIV